MEYTEDADRRELLLHSAYDSDTVRAMERPLLDKGVPLMRMAAQAAAHMAAGMLDDEDLALEDTSIVLLAGAGDNGGDGLFAAAALAQEGANVTAIAVGRSLHEAGFASFVRAGGKVLVLDPAADIPGCASGFSAGEAGERLQTAIAVARKSHLIIDAMTGIGIQGSLRGIPAALASALGLDGEAPDELALPNRESSGDFPLVLAVDTPSGVGVNDGSLPGPYIPATVTVTFGAMKPCAVLPPATFACGRIELLDFGFDIDDKDPDVEVVDNSFASDAVRLPRFEDSKYSRGVVGLVTGSQRYPGAAVLTASAAARADPDQDTSVYEHGVLTDVHDELMRQVDGVLAAGVKPERIIIDPGLGFSKPGIEHNLPLLTGLETFRATGYPVLIGQSRKRFISAMLTEAGAAGADGPIMAQRDDVTAALSALSAEHGAWAVRVHDVAKSRAAVIAGNTWREYA